MPLGHESTDEHPRSLVLVGASDWKDNESHDVMGRHTRSLVNVAGLLSYSVLVQVESVLQTRSEVTVGEVDSNSLLLHDVNAEQTRLLVSVGAWLSYS